MQNGLASSQGRFAALFHIRAMMRGKIAWLFGGRGGLRLVVAVGFRVARTIRVGHRVAAEVFEVFLHPLDEDDQYMYSSYRYCGLSVRAVHSQN